MRTPWVAAALGAALYALGWWSWHPVPIGVWHDDGAYVLMAQSIAAGDGLTWAGVANAPPAAKFPPLFPAVAAGVLRWGPDARQAAVPLARLNLGLMALAGVLYFLLLTGPLGVPRIGALGATAVLWTAPALWRLASVPLSEPLFMVACLAFLLAASRLERSGTALLTATLLLAFAAAFHTRTAGVALAGAAAIGVGSRRGWARGAGLATGMAVIALPWVLWSRAATAGIAEPLRDVLGSYGGWLAEQALRNPLTYVAFALRNAWEVWERAITILVPLLSGWPLLAAAIVLAPIGLFGLVRLGRASPTVAAFVVFYLIVVALWPFQSERLVAPVLPLVAAAIAGPILVSSGPGPPPGGVGRAPFWALLALAVGFALPNFLVLARGGHLEDFDVRARALAAASEAVGSWVPVESVVGAPELWAGLHIYTGRTVSPSARFLPLARAGPSWGTPEQQYRVWIAAGIDYVLAEHAGGVHGDALDRVDAECPGGAVELVATMPGSLLARLNWDAACRERLGLGGAGERPGGDARGSTSADSPLDLAFLGRVDLLGVAFPEQDLLHLGVEELPRFRVPGIESVVVDQQGLVHQPVLPAILTDVTKDLGSEVILEGSLIEPRLIFITTLATDRTHSTIPMADEIDER